MVPLKYVYIVALIPFCIVWAIIFFKRKGLRQEILVMGLLIGFLSVVTSYYWWTVDWWRPLTLSGTRVGIEDFILGFTTGGIMATIYEVVFKKTFYKREKQNFSRGFIILLLLAQVTMWLFYVARLTTFWSSTVAMLVACIVMLLVRRDLFFNAVFSGVFMCLISLLFYSAILFLSPVWIEKTYLDGLSGIKLIGIPIEEYVFWFLAGMVWGPFYEYWQGEKLKKLNVV